jgi:hypothetical protein
MKTAAYSAIVLLLILLSCSKDKVNLQSIPSDFMPIVDRFVAEGAARTVHVDISNLQVKFVEASTLNGFCGVGNPNPYPVVQISDAPNCWSSITSVNQEILLFHELGHAILGRPHLNDTLSNGDFKSMMFAGNQFGVYNESTPERRKYYLDELFDQSTPPPVWSSAPTTATIVFSDSISLPNPWIYSSVGATTNSGMITSDAYSSPTHSLQITSTSAAAANTFSSWAYALPTTNFPIGSALAVKVRIKLVNVTGNGIYVAIRGDGTNGIAFFNSTQSNLTISGTSDFTGYSVRCPYFPENVTSIRIFLILDGSSSGTAFLDDVRVVNYR